MSRYIDADALKRKAQKVGTEAWKMKMTAPIETTLNQFIDWIDNAPSIDIVRCQDCKYWVYNFNGCKRNPCTEPWYATDFCNYGEREGE